MPIPKGQQKLYSVVVATCQKRGGSRGDCKAKADKAVRDAAKKKKKAK